MFPGWESHVSVVLFTKETTLAKSCSFQKRLHILRRRTSKGEKLLQHIQTQKQITNANWHVHGLHIVRNALHKWWHLLESQNQDGDGSVWTARVSVTRVSSVFPPSVIDGVRTHLVACNDAAVRPYPNRSFCLVLSSFSTATKVSELLKCSPASREALASRIPPFCCLSVVAVAVAGLHAAGAVVVSLGEI